MIETSIIIPTYNLEHVNACIASIIVHTENYEIIFVLDKSAQFQKELEKYGRVILTKKPFIFSHRVNLGIKEARGEYICVLNDDTMPQKNWLDDMILANRLWGPAMVGARCQERGCSNPDAIDRGQPGNNLTKHTLNMFATLIPRRVLDVIGLLDERFVYYGGEDDDYSLRALRHGFQLIISTGCVYHHGGAGYSKGVAELINKTEKVFYKKWGVGMPRCIPQEHWKDPVRERYTKPLISVLMPTKNHEDYIFEAIESVLKQSYGNFELLIGIDGLPQSKTENIIKQFNDKRIEVYIRAFSVGSCAMRNELFKKSKGEFMALMDSDDIMMPGRLEKQLDAMDPYTDIVYSPCIKKDEAGARFEN